MALLPHALSPDTLIHEIGLLLDFVSGTSGGRLGSGGTIAMLSGERSADEALKRYFEICQRLPPDGDCQHSDIGPEELEFLLDLRDTLNALVKPATGATIAFSILVARDAPRVPRGSDTGATPSGPDNKASVPKTTGNARNDAERAFPDYVEPARSLRNWMFRIQIAAITTTFVVSFVYAYAYWGNFLLQYLAVQTTQFETLETAIRTNQADMGNRAGQMATAPPAGMASVDAAVDRSVAPLKNTDNELIRSLAQYCLLLEQKSSRDTQTVSEKTRLEATIISSFGTLASAGDGRDLHYLLGLYQTCSHRNDVATRRDETYGSLNQWISFGTFWATRTITDRAAANLLAITTRYLLPLIMGMLGAMAYVLRNYLSSMGARVLTLRDLRQHAVRIVLGTLSGVAIGIIFGATSGSNSASGAVVSVGATDFTDVASAAAPALAFLAGYSVEVAFRFIDTLAAQLFAGASAAPAQPAPQR